jgi:hypothetical protein
MLTVIVSCGVVATTAAGAQNADHEDLAAGATYVSGDNFASQGVGVAVSDLVTSAFTTSGFARVEGGSDNAGLSGLLTNEVNVNNVTLTYTFDQAYTQLTFDFGEFGGNNTFEINGDKREFGDMESFFASSPVIGGVAFSVVLGGSQGEVIGLGLFNEFSIGGQELYIDTIAAVPAPGAAGLAGVLGMAALRRRR